MFNLFKATDIRVWFDSVDMFHKFEKTVALDQFTENNIKKVNQVETVIGGFEDGHVEVTYPIKRNKVAGFKMMVAYFGHFFESTGKTKLEG